MVQQLALFIPFGAVDRETMVNAYPYYSPSKLDPPPLPYVDLGGILQVRRRIERKVDSTY